MLTKGYPASKIELEHKWSLGRRLKGKLDILVKDNNNKSYLMIECKTWGEEYNKEYNRMVNKDGGQLLSYFQQDKNVKWLCLYKSKLDNQNKVEYESSIIKIKDDYSKLNTVKEIYERWDKQFNPKGIFEEDILPYHIAVTPLIKDNLKTLTEGDSSVIYNHFLEILRHNVVSDKANAFNKIFNLFLCKILDEEKTRKDEKLNFQWIEGVDDEVSLLERLNDLYKEGMSQYLNKDVSDYSKDQIEKKFGNSNEILKIFRELRLYKNNEFAFTEVFNEKTFKENAKIVREVVELLQRWQIRYTHKQQFLGDFFELLLNTGFKQESGQFFTPVPLTRFILGCLPLEKIIKDNIIKKKDVDFIPYIIDFACGSGHFLTEAMDMIDKVIEKVRQQVKNKTTTRINGKLESYKHDPFQWAEDHIYGIDKDYRLIKTSKISCFLHGDGEANLIHADGLASFGSKEYKDKLSKSSKEDPKENRQFDILVANPPYSISGFKNTIQMGSEDFELYDSLTDKSSEIEVLFIERMKQLLKDDGYAGIILPSSLLSNSGIYSKARKMLLEYFDFKAIIFLGGKTFMATGTKTIILFLQRKSNNLGKQINQKIECFFEDFQDTEVNEVNNAFSLYTQNVYEKSIEEYRENLNKLDTKKEQEKMLIYFLVSPQNIMIVNSGTEVKAQKDFLGYEFSNRRGKEGIKKGEGKLLDEENLHNPKKTNSYILKQFLKEEINNDDIDEELKEHVFTQNLVDCFDWERNDFDTEISLNTQKKTFESKYPLEVLEDVAFLQKGSSITEDSTVKGNIPVIASGKEVAYYHNDSNRKKDIITVAASGEAGYLWYHDYAIWASDCITIKGNEEKALTKYLYSVLKSFYQDYIFGLARGRNQKHVYDRDLKSIKIPLPPLEVQQKIIDEIGQLDIKEKTSQEEIELKTNQIDEVLGLINTDFKTFPRVRLGDIALLKKGTSITEDSAIKGNIPVIASGKKVAYYHNRSNREKDIITVSASGEAGYLWYHDYAIWASDCITIKGNEEKALTKYLYSVLKSFYQDYIFRLARGQSQKHVYDKDLKSIKILLPPIEKQKEIVEQIKVVEEEINELKNIIRQIPRQKEDILNKYL